MTSSFDETLNESERAVLRNIILSLADTTLLLGYRIHEQAPCSPSMNDANALQGISTGLFGASYHLFDILKSLGESPEQLERRTLPTDFSSIDLLDDGFDSWEEFLISAILVHFATTVRWHAFVSSKIVDIRGLSKKVVQESRFHSLYLSGAYQACAVGQPGAKESFQQKIGLQLPRALRWFGQDSQQVQSLVEKGILSLAPQQERATFLRNLQNAIPLKADQPVAPMSWPGWDDRRRRSAGTGPDLQTLQVLSLKTIDDSIVWESSKGRAL